MSESKRRGGYVWVWALLVSLLLLAGLPILGLVIGFNYLGNRPDRAVGYWRSLGTPPEAPTTLVDANDRYVYLRGEDGSLLECDHRGATADNACWKRVDEMQGDGAHVDRDDAYRDKRAPPPGPVVESLDLAVRPYAEQVVYMQFALLEDGSVWVWRYTGDANTSLGILFGAPLCGLALAVVLVVVIWLVVGVRALVRRRKRKQER
jgi:hypothetical protein